MVLVFRRVSGSTYCSFLFSSSRFKCVRPFHPRRRPITSQLFSVARYVTSLITELRPGTSPPPVSMPMRLVAIVGGGWWEDLPTSYHLAFPFYSGWKVCNGNDRRTIARASADPETTPAPIAC